MEKRYRTMRMCAVRLPHQTWARLQELADRDYVTPSAVVRRAVMEFLKRQEERSDEDAHERGEK